MSQKELNIKPVAAAVGVALLASLAFSCASAASDNPFLAADLESGYLVAGNEAGDSAKGGGGNSGKEMGEEGKCGEGKCGEGKCGEGKCGKDGGTDGSCGGDKAKEGSCGGDHASDSDTGADKETEATTSTNKK